MRGRKTASSDPDLGAWTYAYDTASELVSQTDAKNQTSTFSYDKLGRVSGGDLADAVGGGVVGPHAGHVGLHPLGLISLPLVLSSGKVVVTTRPSAR